ncbi:serine/threonine-protein phosphatase 6 regulatory ankyrin repeat subunit A-like [Halichondria panicea]|uniref:serine/threonine-protein phosphatase 6 regulatory ankyrin repeat subunit A-like n=1 Tax=Halichondria panicea TaxID=6063 RepID=UPI00312B3BAA
MADDSQSCDTPLHTAASCGDSDEVRELLKTKQYEIDVRNSHNQTSLHLACANGHLDTVWTLANDFGADIGAIDNGGNTPLLFAAKNKHVQIIIMLVLLSMCGRQLCNGIRLPCSFSRSRIDSHHVKIFEDVLFEYYNDSEKNMVMISRFFLDYIEFKDYKDEGFVTLLVAASLGLKDLIDRLVKAKKAELKKKGFHGLSILHCACFGGHILLLETLISKYGIDPLLKDKMGCSGLYYAATGGIPYSNYDGHIEVIDKLVLTYGLNPADEKSTPLHRAAIMGYIETVRHLIVRYKVKVDCTDNSNNTPSMLAVLNGHMTVLDVLVKEFSSNCHIRGFNGFTLLHYACEQGHIELIDKLVMEYGLNLADRDDSGNTPLHVAAMRGHVKTMRHFISGHSADIECTNNQNNTPLILAALNGHTDVLDALIKEFNSSCQVRGYNGYTLLHYACYGAGHIELIDKLVLEYGLDLADRDDNGNTPLHIAAWRGHVEAVRHLINKHRADINCTINRSDTPLMLAALNGQIQVFDVLVKEFNNSCQVRGHHGCTLLHHACDGGHIKLIDKLVMEYGLDLADRDDDGNTPLHIAAWRGHVEAVRHLISKHRADINCTNNQNNTPLMLSALNGQTQVLDSLVKEFNNSCQVRGHHGCTLLHQACDGGHIKLIDKLVMEYGLDLAGRDDDGNTPLHIAAWTGHVETVRHLISKYSADIDCTNNNNNTPLMLAVMNGHVHVLDALVKEFNSSCHVRGCNGYTLIHQACHSGHIELIDKLVLEYGLDPADRDNYGNTPLHIAALYRHVEAVRHLINKHNADINSLNNQNATPLMAATLAGNTHVFDALVNEFNSSCHVRGRDGRALLHYACNGGHIELIDKLVMEYGLDSADRDNNGDTPLHIAAMAGHVETVRHLIINHSADIDCTNNNNNTPLMQAALIGNTDVLDALFKEFNSSCHVRGWNGRTLLHKACDGGHIEVINKLVIECALDSAGRDDNGNTPLHIAACAGRVETVRHLIAQHKIDINVTNDTNSTPLCLAAANGHEVVIHAMIKEFDCSSHVRGYNGQTLLHYAAKNGHIKLLNKLVAEYKVDPSIRDYDGNTPLHILCCTPHIEEEKLRTILCKFQYWTVFQVNNNGNTPLHTATIYGQAHCARLLLQKYNAPLFVRNKDGKTALDLAKLQRSHEIVAIFKNHNSEIQSTYRQLAKLAQQEFGGEKNLTRIFVVGHAGAGKSTLVETIKKEGFFNLFSTSTVVPHTAGIIPSTYDSSAYGRMILYDFAGDSEYYSSHAAIMESINTSKGSNIYLILCDLSKGEEAAVTKYSYWLSFLSYNITQFSNTIILPVGSHADVINKVLIKQTLCVLDSVSQTFCSSSKNDDLHIEQSVALDCRKRGTVVNDIKELANKLSKLVSPIGLSPETSTLLGLLKKDFEHVPACKLNLLISHIEETGLPLPLTSSSLYNLIRELHDLGLLMVIEREGDSIENHIIILKISTFTSDVHNKLFSKSAKADLTKPIDQLKLSVGIIPELLLERVLPDYITKESLLKLQYCYEIENLNVEEDHTLSQITSETLPTESAAKQKSHLFFPALCDLKLEEIQWPKSEGDKITLGWCAKCDGDRFGKRFDFFPTRFLHVLIVHLSHNFALKQDLPRSHILSTTTSNSLIAEVYAANPRCRVWSTGLHWLMKNGVEVFVDMPKDADSKELIVLTRSDVQNQVKCSKTLQLVIQKVVQAKIEFCAGIVPTVYLLDPNNLKDEPFTNARNAPKYALRDIEEALAEGTEQVMDKEGQCFSSPIKDWICPTSWAISYLKLLFPMDTFLVRSALKGVLGAQWKLLGLNLLIPWIELDDIDNEATFPGGIAKKEEVI